MTSHLDIVVRISVLLAFALLAMPLLKGRSAVMRRLVLSVAFAAVLVVPFVPAWHVDAPVVSALVGHVTVDRIVGASGAAASAHGSVAAPAASIDWLALAWALGACAVAARFGFGLLSADRLVSGSSEAPWNRALAEAERKTGLRVEVRISTEIEAPAVTGILSPVVLVPASWTSWTEERQTAVLLHELAHVSANDLAVQVLVTIACSMHWFNPLVWVAARRLRLERELAADEAVLRSGVVRASSYAADLLAIAAATPAGTIAMGDKPLPMRIAAIVAERRPVRVGTKTASAVVLGTAAIALGVACTTTTTDSPAPSVAASDQSLQASAQRELDTAVTQWRAKGGTILVMSTKGEVLADVGGHTDEPYVTGSTMKTFLLATAIDEGRVTETDSFESGDLDDATPSAPAPVGELLAVSSNVGFARIFDRVGGARLDRSLRRFHFSPPSELSTEPPGDRNGEITAIGGTMIATPRQVALAYAALADGGDGIVKPDTAARVTTLLEGVVHCDRGTGQQAQVAGMRVAGKTGTSEFVAADGSKRTYASFVGYLPADHPRFVVFVGIDSAGIEAWGGTAAAPVFARVASRALAVRAP